MYGLFEHKRVAFGFRSVPSTFQTAMYLVLQGLTWRTTLAFLDDVIIMGKNINDHLINLREVLQQFKKHNLKLKPKKCEFFKEEIKFLGKIVSGEGIGVDPGKVKVVAEWPVPNSVWDVESFLGFANYHQDHICKFAEVSKSLYELTGPKAVVVLLIS